MADLLGSGNTGLNTAAIPQELLQWDQYVEPAATTFDLDPALIYAVMQEESGGNPNAVSSAGAIGLMQVMPFNAPNDNLYDPQTNINDGCGILRGDLNSNNGDLNQALQSYNGGSYRGHDTQAYANTVMALYAQYSAGGGAGITQPTMPSSASGSVAGGGMGTSSGSPSLDTAWQDVITNVNQMLPYYYTTAIALRSQIGPQGSGYGTRIQ